MSSAPILVGILADRPGPESPLTGEMRRVVEEAVTTGRIDRPVEFVTETARGLPEGTAADVAAAFRRLVDQDVLVVMGPSVTDNGLAIRDLADAARVPCCNWTGSELTRSEWMFHYQIGSLEEEPYLLAHHIASLGLERVAVVQDRSPIGHRYGAFFDQAVDRLGLRITARTLVSPLPAELSGPVAEVRLGPTDALVYLGLGLSAGSLGPALTAADWHPPVFANSALMFGYAQPDWVAHWDGWTYVDAWSERNSRLAELLANRPDGVDRFPMTVAAGDDLGRILVEGLAGAEILTRAGVKDSLERIKRLPAALGQPGTTIGFGRWDRAALKGGFILLRQWIGSRSVALD